MIREPLNTNLSRNDRKLFRMHTQSADSLHLRCRPIVAPHPSRSSSELVEDKKGGKLGALREAEKKATQVGRKRSRTKTDGAVLVQALIKH
jgi:hypothetical protein